MTKVLNAIELGKHLNAVGLLPEECANVEILTPADGLLQIRYTVNLTNDGIARLAQAFMRYDNEVNP